MNALRDAAKLNGNHLLLEGLLICVAVLVVWLLLSTLAVVGDWLL